MLTKRQVDCREFIANDGCRIRELLHPKNDPVILPYSLALATVEPGKASYRHRLKQDEVYYLLEGCGLMHVGAETRPVCAGDVIHIPSEAEQWIENPGTQPLVFAAIVSPPWRSEDDVRL
jgi:mannose-6-phosphate isomerase-like protein (cupin superfamily)